MNQLEQYLNKVLSYSNKPLTPTQFRETVEIAAKKQKLTNSQIQQSIKLNIK